MILPFPYDEDGDVDSGIGTWPPSACIEVTDEDNPVVAQLFGVDGTVLIELRQRPTVPFGYRTSGGGGHA